MKYSLLFVSLILAISCDFLNYSSASSTYKLAPVNDSVENVIERAYYIANVTWQPLNDIEVANHIYSKGTIVRGIPYSSARELDCFVGIHVSFHTFLSAINNPRSLFYTEDISKPPYNARDLCSVYYGTVCSCAVEYALGIDVPYFTSMIDTLDVFTKSSIQVPDAIQLGSILMSSGHMVMVTDIEKSVVNDELVKVSILESAGYKTNIKTYNIEDFYKRWNNDSWIIYNYKGINNVSSFDQADSHEKLLVCPSKGDKACYREGEDIIINILADNATKVVISRESKNIRSYDVSTSDISISGLDFGYYTAELYQEEAMISKCSFVVVETSVSIHEIENHIHCSFSSRNAIPNYIALCSIDGMPYKISEITEKQYLDGYIDIENNINKECYCKVMFKNDYGQISNVPIRID